MGTEKKTFSSALRKESKMVVKVLGAVQSACTRRVLTCLIEKDIEYDIVPIVLRNREQKKPEFMALQV